jgi:hypothetical protein
MTDPEPREPSVPKLETDKADEGRGAKTSADASAASAPADPNKLSADEQMELYEQDLKENDWGHQPC